MDSALSKRSVRRSTEWDINGAGDPTIQGFSTEMSVPRGSDVHFKIRSIATAYRIDIYRMGYYSGAGARLVQTIRPSARLPQLQPECLYEAATRLVDCATWAVSASWSVPATATSGIYFARLIREDADEKPTWRTDHSWVGEYGFHGRPGQCVSARRLSLAHLLAISSACNVYLFCVTSVSHVTMLATAHQIRTHTPTVRKAEAGYGTLCASHAHHISISLSATMMTLLGS